MKLLLDTHALLWFSEGNPALSAAARAAIEEPANERFVSHASAWEIAIKSSIGKLKLLDSYETMFPGVLLANGFKFLSPNFNHYFALLRLDIHHRDPFDRMLIAQALAEGMTLVSCDPHMAPYGVPLLW